MRRNWLTMVAGMMGLMGLVAARQAVALSARPPREVVAFDKSDELSPTAWRHREARASHWRNAMLQQSPQY